MVGLALGLLATWSASRYLQGMLAGAAPLDPLTLALVTLAFLLVAMAASYFPARRAATVDPMIALRHE